MVPSNEQALVVPVVRPSKHRGQVQACLTAGGLPSLAMVIMTTPTTMAMIIMIILTTQTIVAKPGRDSDDEDDDLDNCVHDVIF